ncbi:MAG: CHASE2 domain-containing protein [Calothrix sp. C42_A2020_038]|nr:CHASE2 domain-containing protein [Calothrix sp. C42_A2020_038]
MNCYRYQVGGSLESNALSYVERACDGELYTALKRGEFCYVLNSRQMGKSSLLVRTSHRLRQEGFKCSVVDLTNIGSENITPLQWYKGLVTDLLSGLKLSQKINFRAWWQEQEDISLLQKLSRFIAEVLLVEFKQEQIVIFIDEIDSILTLNFPVDDFFALIRFCYNQRAVNSEYNRLTFAIFGVATPSDLIQDKRRTPFNIGKSIHLEGFILDNIQPLADGLIIKDSDTKEIMRQVLKWTNGQPFLTHKLCQLIFDLYQSQTSEIPSGQEAIWVESIVKKYIINRWEFQDEPQHLRTIRDRILLNEEIAARNLEIYQAILLGEDIISDDSRETIELLLSGLVVNSQGKFKVKNLIYQEVFDLAWVTRQIEHLRPYAQNLKAWIVSNQKDSSYLLRGTALETALAWSYNKKLTDQDYRFLSASQELAKREIEKDLALEKQARQIEQEKSQFALESAKLAQHFLAQARKIAKKNAQLRLGKRWVGLITLIVASAVIILRLAGFFQGMEWAMLDRFFQARPSAKIDPRIVIVAIDELHIQKTGQYPMSDMVLAQALQTLKSYNPKAIGLDLYRDLPVEPGSEELTQLYKTTPNLIGVEKGVGSPIAPPPVLAELQQVGLADQVLDGDGKVRRALLSIRRNGKLSLNLGLRLALSYLETQGITPKYLPNNRIQIGKALIVPFESNFGGYVGADAGGYQILLNYYGTQKQFQAISITDVLEKKVHPDAVRNRIVLIGATAESINDFFQTPYSSKVFDNPQQMPGVVVHANIASQILNGALDGRPMLQVWSPGVEWMWILLSCGVGTTLSWYFQSLKLLVVITTAMGGTLTIIAYLAFLLGWWIPIIPPLVGLIVAAFSLPIVIAKQLEIIQLSQTVKLLIAFTEGQSTAGQIAIEYLKQAESKENQILIDKILREKS